MGKVGARRKRPVQTADFRREISDHRPNQRALGAPNPGILAFPEKESWSASRRTEPGFPTTNRQYERTEIVGLRSKAMGVMLYRFSIFPS